jgi:SAM-dependent methyltransferase
MRRPGFAGADVAAAAMNRTPNFDNLARVYRWMEYFSFGPWLALTRRTFLSEYRACRRALVIGDGDGRFTARLLRENLEVRVDAVDASAAMLESLLRRAGQYVDRVTIHKADARDWEPSDPKARFDLIATHFFLDCLAESEVEALAVKLRRYVSPGAMWVVSEFAVPRGELGAIVARTLISFLYWCFGWLTGLKVRKLPDYGKALGAAGFVRAQARRRLRGILIAELWSVTFGVDTES